MRKELRYMVFDCETATLPFADEIAQGDPERKKKIAIARPLIYDTGWTITNRKGEILDRKQFLIAETFAVPSIFNTAYYAEKRPKYLEMLAKGETSIVTWETAIQAFLQDLKTVDAVGAYNSMFDFKKALPFTELYIKKLYSADYQKWEKLQRDLCIRIANEKYHKDPEKEFDAEFFKFRGVEYPLFDLWGLATKILLNNATYKKQCLEHDLLSASGLYFKTSAETSYQYLVNKYDFVESHTALDDAIIETFILSKIASRHAVEIGITFFPFRDLGETVEFVTRRKNPNFEECQKVARAIRSHLDTKEDDTTAYYRKMENKLIYLEQYMGL